MFVKYSFKEMFVDPPEWPIMYTFICVDLVLLFI